MRNPAYGEGREERSLTKCKGGSGFRGNPEISCTSTPKPEFACCTTLYFSSTLTLTGTYHPTTFLWERLI